MRRLPPLLPRSPPLLETFSQAALGIWFGASNIVACFVLLGVGYLANDTDSVNYFGECISIIIGVCCGFAALLLVLAARFASTPASAALRAYYEEEFMRTPPAPSTAAVAPVTPQHGRDVV